MTALSSTSSILVSGDEGFHEVLRAHAVGRTDTVDHAQHPNQHSLKPTPKGAVAVGKHRLNV